MGVSIMKRLVLRLCLTILPLIALCMGLVSSQLAYAQADQWTTSLHDIARTGSSSDSIISKNQASTLVKKWSLATGGPIASQPAIVNGIAYVGSWDGNEYAINVSTGAVIWKTFTGITTGYSYCNPTTAGISSAATVLNGVVYVGGGDSNWYALNASTGTVLWKIPTGDNSAAGGHYNWSSPLIVNGYAYVGIASFGDCPLVQGQLLKVNLSTKQIVGTLNLVPSGQAGGGIWTSPAYDTATGRIFTITGTEQQDSQQYAQAILAIDPNSMTVVDSWHLPENQAVADSDWTTSTALFTDANNRQLVVASNKNGVTYAFLRSNLATGPVWQQQIAIGSNCAACGNSTVSSAALGQGEIFQAGGTTTINGVGAAGSVQAWNETTGAIIWQHPESGPVIGAITYDNGMVIDGAGSAIEVLDANNGQRLYSYDTGPGSHIFAAPSVSNGIIITGNTNGNIYALSLPSSNNKPPKDPNCPSGWLCQDIGAPNPIGSETVSGNTWNVSVGGTGVGGASDSFRLMTEPSAGDVQIIADVTNEQSISAGVQAGMMLRQTNDPGSPYYAIFKTPNGVSVQYRNTFGGNTTIANTTNPGGVPLYLEIQRLGDKLTAATSTDGSIFTYVPGSTETVIMPYTSMAGLAAASGSSGVSSSSSFTNVSIGAPSNVPQDTPSPSACPTGWNCADIGAPITVGDQSQSGNTWTFKAAGSGADGSSDQLHYVWQTAAGDTTVTTHITGQTNTNATAKAGIMFRADTSTNAAYYGAFITPSGTVKIQYRDTKGLPINPLITTTGAFPQYLQVIRAGTTFTTYTSTDGVNWSPAVGGAISLSNLSGSILAGFAATSANTTNLSTVTADSLTIANGSVTPPTTCPGTWTCQDIGVPLPQGSQYYYNGTWSTLGFGKDIWNASDDFRFVSQNVAGDGSVSVHVTSQTFTDPWAKAGIMMRATNDPGSPYFGLFVTPANGTVIQCRTAQGNGTSQVTGMTSTTPTYLKVTRAGNTFTAYTSTDGINWVPYPNGSITLTLPTTAMVGLANTSHSQFNNNTTTFDHLMVTPVNANLPSPWIDNDLDNVTPAGNASFANGTFTVNGGGNDIWNTPYGNLDQSHYVSQPLSGDGSLIAHVASQTNTSPWAKAGIMIKQSAAADAPYVLIAVTPSNGVLFQSGFNSSTSSGTAGAPLWLKLTRTGNTVTGYTSPDGTTWTQVGSASITLTDPVTGGLFVCSHASGTLGTATFDNVNWSASTTGIPSPWADTDVNDTMPGSAAYANGVFTVNGAGNDIWNDGGTILDQFNYSYQTLSGNATITARITSQTNTSPWAKAGIMIKQSTTSGSPYALLGVTPTNGMLFQYNYNTSINAGNYTFPEWLRLIRSGTTITAYTSPDGTTWTQVGTTTTPSLTDPVTVGLFVCSHASGTLGAATFDNVTVTQP
jgi:outer membrane protein assembly factor BamB/regulation of enolase protein 1 (concanavalin A-like superfamily)